MSAPFRPALAALLSAVVAIGLPASSWAEGDDAPEVTPQVTAETEVLLPAGLSGAYLAGRVAESENDFRAAAKWYALALQADASNPALIEGALYAALALGDFANAAPLADRLSKGPKEETQLSAFAHDAADAAAGDWAALIKGKEDGRKIGPVLDDLVLAWAHFGEGKLSEALKDFDDVSKMKGMQAVGLYHKALALAAAGDFEGAEKILSGDADGKINLNRRGIIARVQILSQLERNEDAEKLLGLAFGSDPNPSADALRARLNAGETLPFDIVPDAKAGVAEAFYTLGNQLLDNADPAYVLIHSRIANHLDPANVEALLLTARALEQVSQFDLAGETYALVPKDDPLFFNAEIGRSDALYAAGKKEAALEVVQALARNHPDLLAAQTALAELLRQEDRCAEAIAAYDAALALVPKQERGHWSLVFSRGVCHEKLKDWPKAEADFRKALELRPGQPQVLNYLGYSMLDRGINLDESLELIEEAVKAEPDAGYIIDSLAWAYFRLGRYEDALEPMEKASLLEPSDPVVTDHLGDVYWMVGRTREAEFQWHRALSFSPEEKEAARIRKKLEVGLDQVMEAEAATTPIAPAPASTAAPADGE